MNPWSYIAIYGVGVVTQAIIYLWRTRGEDCGYTSEDGYVSSEEARSGGAFATGLIWPGVWAFALLSIPFFVAFKFFGFLERSIR